MPLPLVSPVPATRPREADIGGDGDSESDGDDGIGLSHVGGYELLRRIGCGSCGEVYRAAPSEADVFDESKLVALKLVRQSAPTQIISRFEREASITCALPKSPHLVAGLDSGIANGRRFLAMDLVQGVSLQKLLQSRGRLNWNDATRIVLQIAKALTLLSAHGIVHRDVKPDNIIVNVKEGQARLVDFGLARRVQDREDEADEAACFFPSSNKQHGGHLTAVASAARMAAASSSATAPRLRKIQTPAGCAIGSPAFMAPEQVKDSRSSSSAADVYGLGVTWYAALTGRLPFDGTSPTDVLDQVLNGETIPPSQYATVPPAVEAAVKWLMEPIATARPSTHGASLVETIEKILDAPDDIQIVVRAKLSAQQEAQAAAKQRLLYALAVGFLVLSLVLAALRELLSMAPGQTANDDLEGSL